MSYPKLLGALAMGLIAAALSSAQTPDFTGTWQMDAAKSQVADGRTLALNIEAPANKLKVTTTIRNKGGTDKTAQFTCGTDGKECEFDEGGHKSKVSMWYLGPALNVCKTDGPAGDVVNMWKLERSGDGKGLTLTVTHIDPSTAPETIAFTKGAALSAAASPKN